MTARASRAAAIALLLARGLRRGSELSPARVRRWMRTSRTPANRDSRQRDAVEQYWTGFADPIYDRLDRRCARRTTRILRVAAANLHAARAARRLAGFDQYPDRNLWRAATRTTWIRSSNCPASTCMTANSMPPRPASTGFGNSICSAASGATSRRPRRCGRRAATLQDARVSVIAEVARNYFILRGLQDQLALTQRNADNQFNTLKLTRNAAGGGQGQ